MHRRRFLYQSGMVLPAILLAPAVYASESASRLPVLLIRDDETRDGDLVEAAFSADGRELRVADLRDVKELKYAREGFHVTLGDGRRYLAGSLALQTVYAVDAMTQTVTIGGEGKKFSVPFGGGALRQGAVPAFWSFNTEHFRKEEAMSFMRREGPAFCCIS